MARVKNVIPSYLLHTASGQARVRIGGHDHLLGPYGSEESRVRYGELVARFAGGQTIDPVSVKKDSRAESGPALAELIQAFKKHAEAYYVKPDGTQTAEMDCLRSAIKPFRELYAFTPIADFTPLMLKACRETFIANGWSRGYCNRSTNRIRSIFKWGVSNGLVPVTVWQALTAIEPLKAGRCEAHDNKRRETVPDADIEAVRKKLRQRNRDIVDLLLFTAARIGELLSVSWSMIDRSGDVWVAELQEHKNAYRGKTRKLHFGKRAQAILARYEHVPSDDRIFETRRDTFSQVLKAACVRAGVPKFVPHQLRHTAGTRIRDTFGVESAQASLGHAAADMTAVYTRNTDKLARDTAAAVG